MGRHPQERYLSGENSRLSNTTVDGSHVKKQREVVSNTVRARTGKDTISIPQINYDWNNCQTDQVAAGQQGRQALARAAEIRVQCCFGGIDCGGAYRWSKMIYVYHIGCWVCICDPHGRESVVHGRDELLSWFFPHDVRVFSI